MIEVGEYGRTNLGNIIRFAWLEKAIGVKYEDRVILIKDNKPTNEFYYFKENDKIVKHSKNIIELIEEGDYVNGLEVYKGKVASGKEKLLVGNHIINGMALEVVDIKSILTKEQFSSVEYRLE